jgi:hypothetical protein
VTVGKIIEESNEIEAIWFDFKESEIRKQLIKADNLTLVPVSVQD